MSRRRKTTSYYKRMKAIVAMIGILLVALVWAVSFLFDKNNNKAESVAESTGVIVSENTEIRATDTTETVTTSATASEEVTTESTSDEISDEITTEVTTTEEITTEEVTTEEITTTETTTISEHVDVTAVDYSNIVMIGDSRTLSLATGGKLEYALVPENSVCATWGGQLTDASALQNTINGAAKQRSAAVFWYGVNDVQLNPERDNAEVFIANYSVLLETYSSLAPNSHIYIVSVLNTGINERDHYEGQEENIIKYNNALRALCDAKGYTYLDATGLLVGEEGILEDNIHFSESWYRELYLPYLINALGLH